MQGYAIKLNQTAQPLAFLMVQSSDHIGPATGLTPTVTIRKPGGSFAAPAGAVSEVGSGWYQVAGNATDANTLGPLLLHATAGGADPTDALYPVVAFDPQSATNLGLSGFGSVTPADGSIVAAKFGAGAIDANAFAQAAADKAWATAARALTDKANFSLAASQSFNNAGQTTKLAATLAAADVTGNLPANVLQYLNTNLDFDGTPAAITASTITLNSADPGAAFVTPGQQITIPTGAGSGNTVYTLTSKVAGNQWNVSPAWAAGTPDTSTSRYAYVGPTLANLAAVYGDATAALKLMAQSRACFLGVVSGDSTPTTSTFTANATGSPGLSTAAGFYSTPGSIVFFYSGSGLPKAAKITGYTYSAGVGNFTLGSALGGAPAVGDAFLIAGFRY